MAAGTASPRSSGARCAERDICLTWPAGKALLPAAELFRRHVIDTLVAGHIRPVSG